MPTPASRLPASPALPASPVPPARFARAAAAVTTALAALLALPPSARADDIYWGGNDNSAATNNWYSDITLITPSAPPAATDAAHINNGRVTIPAGLTVSTSPGTEVISVQNAAGTTKTGAAGSIGAAAGSSGTAAVAGYWNNQGNLIVGGAGTGVLDITGTMRTATTYIGRQTGGSGTLSINNGLMQTTGWLHIGGIHANDSADLAGANAGDGNLYIAQTGTLVVGASGARVAYGNVNATASVTVDGLWQNTGYIQIGQWGKATLTVGQTGTITATSYIYIGGGDGAAPATATATIDGRVIAGTTFYVAANRSVGVLTIGSTGWVSATGNLSIGQTANATGTVTVKGGGYWESNGIFAGIGNSSGKGVLTVEQSGSVVTRNTSGNTLVGNGVGGTGTMFIDGLFQAANRYHIGNNGGQGVLDLSGTMKTGIMCVTYSATSVAIATSTMTSGTVFVRDGGYLETAYLQVGQWAKGHLSIAETGTVIVKDYFYTGGGDDSRARQAGIGYTYVAGRLAVTNALGVANAGQGVLDIAETGWVTNGGAANISNASAATGSGTANVAGRWDSQGNFTNANYGKGTLNILPTGTLNVAANYIQKAGGALNISLQTSRTTAYLDIAGAATLSGTLGITDFPGAITGQLTKASQIPADSLLIIRAAGGFNGDFGSINLIGGAPLPSGGFVTFGGILVGGTDYRVGYTLAGVFDLAQGETFEIDIPLADKSTSAHWDGKSLIKTGPGTLIYSATAARHTGPTLINAGTLKITTPDALLSLRGDLVNNSVIDLTTPSSTGHRTLQAARLLGSGTFHMTVNTATGDADRLQLVGDAPRLIPPTIAGTHQLILTDTRADGATATPADLATLTLVRLSDSAINTATLIADLDWDDGSTIYPLHFGPDGAGTLGPPAPAPASKAALAITAAQNLMWAGQQDHLTRRLGDLRAQPADTGLWTRAYASTATLDPADTGDIRLHLYGFTLGADHAWKTLNGNLHAGIFAGYGRATHDLTSTDADGDSTLLAGGLYAAWLHETGWFAGATLGLARHKNDFTATDTAGATTGKHTDTALALSLELGRRLDFAQGWFAEPAARLSLTRLDQTDYTTTGAHNLPVRASAATIHRARLGALAGRTLALTATSTLQIHARLGGLYESSAGGKLTIGDLTRRPNLDGARAEAGLGLLWRQNTANQFYFDYDATLGKNYEQPWTLTLGIRHTF